MTTITEPRNLAEYIEKYAPALRAAFNKIAELKRLVRIDRTNFDNCIYSAMFQITDSRVKGYYFLDVSIQAYNTHVDIILDILDHEGNELHVQAIRYSHTFVACSTDQVAINVYQISVNNLLRELEQVA